MRIVSYVTVITSVYSIRYHFGYHWVSITPWIGWVFPREYGGGRKPNELPWDTQEQYNLRREITIDKLSWWTGIAKHMKVLIFQPMALISTQQWFGLNKQWNTKHYISIRDKTIEQNYNLQGEVNRCDHMWCYPTTDWDSREWEPIAFLREESCSGLQGGWQDFLLLKRWESWKSKTTLEIEMSGMGWLARLGDQSYCWRGALLVWREGDLSTTDGSGGTVGQ